MRRFSILAVVLVVVGAIFTGVVFPVVAHFIQEQPQETANLKEPWHERSISHRPYVCVEPSQPQEQEGN